MSTPYLPLSEAFRSARDPRHAASSPWRRSASIVLALVLATGLFPGGARADGPSSPGAPSPEVPPFGGLRQPGIPLRALEGVHTNLIEVLPPIRQGGVLVFLRSPAHRLVLHRSWLHLRPAPDVEPGAPGLPLDAELVVDLEGEGELIADVTAVGLAQQFRDEVDVPRQVVRLAGRVALVRRGDGFDVHVLELADAMDLRVESGLVRRLVDLCEGLAIVPLLSLDCPALRGRLARVEVPLPPVGSVVQVPDALLGPGATTFLEGWAATSAVSSEPPVGR